MGWAMNNKWRQVLYRVYGQNPSCIPVISYTAVGLLLYKALLFCRMLIWLGLGFQNYWLRLGMQGLSQLSALLCPCLYMYSAAQSDSHDSYGPNLKFWQLKAGSLRKKATWRAYNIGINKNIMYGSLRDRKGLVAWCDRVGGSNLFPSAL